MASASAAVVSNESKGPVIADQVYGSIILSTANVAECLALCQKPFVVLNLQRYNITKAEATVFFDTLTLLPLLNATENPAQKFVLFKMISDPITNETNKKNRLLVFAKTIGCAKMVDFLTTNFSD
jgi:hypothetical protein